MAEDITPHDLNRPPESIDPWLANYVRETYRFSRQASTGVVVLTDAFNAYVLETAEWKGGIDARMQSGAQHFDRLDRQLDDLRKRGNPGHNPGNKSEGITFKWLVEKFGAPLLVGILSSITTALIIFALIGDK